MWWRAEFVVVVQGRETVRTGGNEWRSGEWWCGVQGGVGVRGGGVGGGGWPWGGSGGLSGRSR